MQVQVTGKHVDVGEALRSRVTDELTAGIAKYFERGGGAAEVVVSRERSAFKVDCAVTLASGHALTSHATGADAHVAFDAALERMIKRIRRYKHKLKDHHPQALARQAETAAYFVIADPGAEDADVDSEPEPQGGEPIIIAETERPVRAMTVSMAVMELDITEAQTIVFRNAAHGGLSVVYRRPDGNIGWIDPERTGRRTTKARAGSGPSQGLQ